MRLEYVCELELGYPSGFHLIRPYGGEEGTGFGVLDGTVGGPRLRGVVQAVNHPHRRSDGAMHPDLHGTIATDDGARLMLRVRGRTRFGADGTGRQTLVVAFEAEDVRYRWLNDLVCVYEGVIAMPRGSGQVYACINDLGEHASTAAGTTAASE